MAFSEGGNIATLSITYLNVVLRAIVLGFVMLRVWRYDTQYNDTQLKRLIYDTQHNNTTVMLSDIMLRALFIWCYAECRYVECHYAKWRFLFDVMLSVITQNIVVLSVVAPTVFDNRLNWHIQQNIFVSF